MTSSFRLFPICNINHPHQFYSSDLFHADRGKTDDWSTRNSKLRGFIPRFVYRISRSFIFDIYPTRRQRKSGEIHCTRGEGGGRTYSCLPFGSSDHSTLAWSVLFAIISRQIDIF
ncbi:hypothetical protein CDAR_491551 [Caerostris darwini]|uniref:Uncharacterized protein n=1 Tax=Caerostris darwini TaxID=1538125 RepID=A0AAV4XAG7_9ARAC|nr:hypothetical protein CDAR_491551 [Caerostris darwini]